ncbi:hypothetical protein ATB98_23705 [Sinorhizobium saheli]|jgi:hypothetical protein|uniref:Uncharacterized protein n=1 Tax=Sinorhizobium saheli TaxID=36856 RepID=A0A178XHW9_SINSA|nr:hypothetical protein ATB98_23705 [Sinorhizobium saheli]
MKTVRVYGPPETALPFDLRDFLELLAPRARTALWTVSAVDAGYQWFDATGPGGANLEAMAQSDKRVTGQLLTEAARDTLQVIWGEFTGSLPQAPDQDWVIIRAIDSTFYEVTTNDDEVLRQVEASFGDVRFCDKVWKPSSDEAVVASTHDSDR